MGTDFHLFKEGIEPKWEDEKCAKGGKWTYYFPKSRDSNDLDENWLNLLLELIGEQFDESVKYVVLSLVLGKSNIASLFGRRLHLANLSN